MNLGKVRDISGSDSVLVSSLTRLLSIPEDADGRLEVQTTERCKTSVGAHC